MTFSLLQKLLDDFTSESWSKAVGDTKLAEAVRKYQDPKQADTIMKVQQELDETKIVLVRCLELSFWLFVASRQYLPLPRLASRCIARSPPEPGSGRQQRRQHHRGREG